MFFLTVDRLLAKSYIIQILWEEGTLKVALTNVYMFKAHIYVDCLNCTDTRCKPGDTKKSNNLRVVTKHKHLVERWLQTLMA